MERSAKKSLTFKDIADEILEQVPKEDTRLYCPFKYKPDSSGKTSIVRCCTTCWLKCEKFVSFRWVVDSCSDFECQYQTPCLSCLERIATLKVVIRGLAIANRAFIGEYSSEHVVKEWAYKRSR